ncbi:Rad53p [Rhizophagus irregularis DAOM 197198w]|uniref:Rad53p n=2 Tax=Rhizophagus irregularis TaxID=588596 RepID=A0A015LNU0_RHIIW|nr:Rad53p [Rhizophagus irregularis DAOM 197198w]
MKNILKNITANIVVRNTLIINNINGVYHVELIIFIFTNWTSEDDDYIREKQLNASDNIIVEWIPYDQFNDIEEIESIGARAVWKNGPLKYNVDLNKYERNSNEKGTLQSISSSDDKILNKAWNMIVTKNYFLVFYEKYFENYCNICGEEYSNKQYEWCNPCQINYLKANFENWTSGSKQIDDYIQEKQLQIYNLWEMIFEWIPYNQFNNIKEMGYDSATVTWKDGPLYYNFIERKWMRKSGKKVTIKYLNVEKNFMYEYLNKVKPEGISYGISQNLDTKDYILVINEICCEKCGEKYTNDLYNLCKQCLFSDVKEIGKGGFATVYSATWDQKKVALKCLHNSRNFVDEFLNEINAYSAYSNQDFSSILKLYGISQNPDTEEYIIVLEYAEGGNFNDYLYRNYKIFNWLNKIQILIDIIKGLKEIHQKQMVHRDFHIGNILFKHTKYNNTCISDMGLCGEIGNIDETKIYGVMPYVAPEILRGNPYTQAADIYSFGMIMYFIATGRQPFSDCAHDELLALNICNGIRPEINEPKAPKCYIDLMKKCWDPNPSNRPNAFKIEELIWSFRYSYMLDASEVKLNMKFEKKRRHYKIEKQFKESDEYRKANPLSIKHIQSATHPQAIYTSRLLNSFTKDLPQCDKNMDSSLLKYDDNMNNNSIKIIDFFFIYFI